MERSSPGRLCLRERARAGRRLPGPLFLRRQRSSPFPGRRGTSAGTAAAGVERARMRCGERRACAGNQQIPALRPRVPVPRVRHGCPCGPPAPAEARAPAAAVRRAPRARLRRSCAARAACPTPRRAAPRQDSAAHSDRAACALQAAVQGRLDRLGEFADRRENDGIFLEIAAALPPPQEGPCGRGRGGALSRGVDGQGSQRARASELRPSPPPAGYT